MTSKPINFGRIIAALRRVWLYSEPRRDCLKAAKVSRGLYKCDECKKAHPKKQVQVDHIIEVGKFETWDLFMERLFCDVSNLQILCKACHLIKTNDAKTAKAAAKVKAPKKPRAKKK